MGLDWKEAAVGLIGACNVREGNHADGFAAREWVKETTVGPELSLLGLREGDRPFGPREFGSCWVHCWPAFGGRFGQTKIGFGPKLGPIKIIG